MDRLTPGDRSNDPRVAGNREPVIEVRETPQKKDLQSRRSLLELRCCLLATQRLCGSFSVLWYLYV